MANPGDTQAKEMESLAQAWTPQGDTDQNSVTQSEGFSEQAVTQTTEGIADADTEKVEDIAAVKAELENVRKQARDFQSQLHKTQQEKDRYAQEVESNKNLMAMLAQQAEADVAQKQTNVESDDLYDPQNLRRFIGGEMQKQFQQQEQRRRLEQMRQDFFSKVPDATEQDFMDTLNWSQRNLTPYDVWLVRNRGAEMAKLAEEARKQERERIATQAEQVEKNPPSVLEAGGGQARPKKPSPVDQIFGGVIDVDRMEEAKRTIGWKKPKT